MRVLKPFDQTFLITQIKIKTTHTKMTRNEFRGLQPKVVEYFDFLHSLYKHI